jgi:hypothetical protein
VRGGAAHAPRAARGPDRHKGREETLAVTTIERGGCGGVERSNAIHDTDDDDDDAANDD